jgi:asparagine synthase (glutamine-hydrolysing)
MCGIAGYFDKFDSLRDKSALKFAQEALKHRGPDDSGLFEDRNHGVGLVHTRLSILDLSPLGHQPMLSDDGKVVLVFNGEIYNFQELRAELETAGHRFRGHSDTEVLLHLYCSCREDKTLIPNMLRRLNGIFAFAIWDSEDETLLVARDGLGVKPFYYRANEEGFAFASEIKALVPLINNVGELDVAAIDRYLTYIWCPGNATPYKDVRKLGPGEAFWVRAGTISEHFTWFQLPTQRIEKLATRPMQVSLQLTVDQATQKTEKHLRQAVHRQMISDVPLGAFLSGGLDSSSIVHFAREKNPNVCCFTIETKGYNEGFADDLPYARKVAKHLNVPLEVITVDSSRMANDLEQMVIQLDEPLADPAPLNVLYISRLARENGIKVLLSGAGGDDLFTGYRRHRALMTEKYWVWMPQLIRKGLELFTSRLNQTQPVFRRIRKLFNGASLDSDSRLLNYFRWIDRPDLDKLYSEDFRHRLGESMAEEPMAKFLEKFPANTSPLERMLALEQRFFLAEHNLCYTDKMSMAVGVEVRVPFLDSDLVDFAATLPAAMKQRGREGKWILKKTMERYLPHDVIYRPKTGFGAPVRRWMRHELRGLVSEVLSERSLKSRGLFDTQAVHQLIKANDQGTIDASYTLLSLLCIELWCRNFLDNFLDMKRRHWEIDSGATDSSLSSSHTSK